MDYLCAKFDNFSFSRFGFIVRTESQNHRQTESHTKADDCYTYATTVGVSDNSINSFKSQIILSKSNFTKVYQI